MRPLPTRAFQRADHSRRGALAPGIAAARISRALDSTSRDPMTAVTLLLACFARSCRGAAALAQLVHAPVGRATPILRRSPMSAQPSTRAPRTSAGPRRALWPERGDGRPSANSTSGSLGRRAAIAPLGHELVELFLVLGHPQPTQELAEFALLFFQPLQRLGAVFIEGTITARRPRPIALPEPFDLRAHALHLVLPALVAMSAPASDLFVPESECEDREPYWPPENEPQDRQHDPSRMQRPDGWSVAAIVQFFASCSRIVHGEVSA